MESTFQIACIECPEAGANTMALDSTGRFAVLSGRKSITLIDLDGDPTELATTDDKYELPVQSTSGAGKSSPIVKKFTRSSKHEPAACHFNRHTTDLFALTNYQVAEVFSVQEINPSKPKLLLRGHSRAIVDVEWSQFDPYVLGTSGADCITNLWDIRDHRRPSASLTSVSSATQVRFCKTSHNLIATSHEIDVRIWDVRQPNLPLYYIAAHLQKINGADWNPSKPNCDQKQLITCSQDSTIKLWDLSTNKVKISSNVQIRAPAWRIRHTPVSANAILTSTLPQLRLRSECTALKLWTLKPSRYEQRKLELMACLVGHTDVIIDFDWRARSTSSDCELVSWSKDQTLRIWRIDQQFIEINVDNSDYEAEGELHETTCDSGDNHLEQPMDKSHNSTQLAEALETNFNDENLEISPYREGQSRVNRAGKIDEQLGDDVGDEDSDSNDATCGDFSPLNELKQEFNLINKNIPNIEFEELNSLRRVCLVTAHAKSVTCNLRITLPPDYPHNSSPIFTITDSDFYETLGLNKETKQKLLQLLNETAKSQLSRNRKCIEPCLRKFITALQKMTDYNQSGSQTFSSVADLKDDPISISAQRDHSVPFPASTGARFCGNLLICFGRPIISTLNKSTSDTANWSVETPRSMAQLSAQLDNMRRQGAYNLSHISISYFYYGAMRRAELQSRATKSSTLREKSSLKYLSGRNKSLQSHYVMSKSYKCGPVILYDVSRLLDGISRDLAKNYVFDKDVIKMCKRNAEIAASFNRKDLVQIWLLAELSSEGVLHSYLPNRSEDNVASSNNLDSDFGDRPWTMHPFGGKLIQSLIDHYVMNCHDVQTAAMLVWTFSSPRLGHSKNCNNLTASNRMEQLSASNASHQIVLPDALAGINEPTYGDAVSDEWNFVNGPETHLYSNSWSNYTIQEQLSNTPHYGEAKYDGPLNQNVEECFPKINILSGEKSLQNDLIMHIYAEVLYKMNLLNQRAMVLKNIGSNSAYSEIFGNRQVSSEATEDRLSNLSIQCYNGACRRRCKSVQCSGCKKFSLYCSICRLPVRGPSSICLKCLHGGHVNHFNAWFSKFDFCPTGCGCNCLN